MAHYVVFANGQEITSLDQLNDGDRIERRRVMGMGDLPGEINISGG
jgi:hypothetical protein